MAYMRKRLADWVDGQRCPTFGLVLAGHDLGEEPGDLPAVDERVNVEHVQAAAGLLAHGRDGSRRARQPVATASVRAARSGARGVAVSPWWA